MSLFIRLCEKNSRIILTKIPNVTASFATAAKPEDIDSTEFRVLNLKPKKVENTRKKGRRVEVPPPRANQMAVDQDWPSVWPGPKTFHPAVVPMPIRQGYSLRDQPPPDKYGNTELMKIPNFLHLSPPAVQRHCEALKKFCTEWPVGLETEDKCRKHFPLEIIISDYCYSSPTIREPLSRIVTLRVKLSSLSLNAHAKDKILRLVKDKYNPETDFITITADRCPMKKQNLEYAEYLLTALFHESWRVEDWESEKAEADMEYYDWDKSKSRTNLITLHAWPNPPTDTDWECIPHVEEYKVAVSDLFNTGEDLHTVNKYKEAVKNVLNLKCEA